VGAGAGDPAGVEEHPAHGGADRAGQVRSAFGPVQAFPQQRPAGLAQPVDVDVERRQPGDAGVGEGEPGGVGEQALVDHGGGDGDAEPPGEVVVAGAAGGERVTDRGAAQGAGRWCRWGVFGHELDQFGDAGVGQPDVPVAALAVLGDEAALDEVVEVFAGGGRRHPGDAGEFARCPRPPVQHRQAEGGAGVVGEEGGEPGQVGCGHGGHHPRPTLRRRPNCLRAGGEVEQGGEFPGARVEVEVRVGDEPAADLVDRGPDRPRHHPR
jgi:hypothetical protein